MEPHVRKRENFGLSFLYDIALLKLVRKIKFVKETTDQHGVINTQTFVRPVCLPSKAYMTQVEQAVQSQNQAAHTCYSLKF